MSTDTILKPEGITPENFVSLVTMKFEDVKKPCFKENKEKGYMTYGDKNDYPNYLLELFDKSGKHAAIVSGKADYVIGNGFAYVDEANAPDKDVKTLVKVANSDGESLDEVGRKVSLDCETFGGAFLEVIFNRKKRVSEIYHLDFMNVRVSKDLLTFYYSENWHTESYGVLSENPRAKITQIKAFDAANPSGKQVLFIREYKPGMKVYPTPNYYASLRYIMIDICIGEYHLNGITNGMFASKLVNFNNGVPSVPEQKEIEKKVNGKFAGSKNAGKIMLSFNKSGVDAPTVVDLSGTDLDKHFDLLNKTTETQIFSSHRVTSPALFGIKTDTVFGNNNELRQAFELFQNTYINSKRQLLEKYFNVILSINGINEVYLQRSEPVGVQFSDATIAAAMGDDEIRERLGMKPRSDAHDPNKGLKGIIKKLNSLSPLVANKIIASMTSNEIRSIAGLEAITGGDVIPVDKATPAKFNEDLDDEKDALVFAGYGQKKSDFEITDSRRSDYENDFQFSNHYFATIKELSQNQKSIIDLLNKDNKIDAAHIAEVLKISEAKVNGLLKVLEADGLIKVSNTGSDEEPVTVREPSADAIDNIDNGGAETTSIKVMYSYEGVQDAKNRPFCAKMLELDRMYSRLDIEAISGKLGYSVWDRRGGWYRAKGDTEARPYCRHFWQTNTVITKK